MFDIVCFSLGNFLCFTILAGIKDQKDPADKLHHGGWMAQIFLWIIIIFLLFSVPNIVLASSVKTFLAIVFFPDNVHLLYFTRANSLYHLGTAWLSI